MSIRKLYLSSIDTSTATAGDVLVYSLANGEIEFGTVETSAGNNIISPNSQYSLTIQDTGESILNSNLVPSTNNTLSLGSPDAVWKDLYVGPGTIYVGDVQLSSVDGGLSITSTTSNTSTILDTSSSNLSATINLVQSNLSALPDSAANDYATYTSIVGLINTVQDNIVSSSGSFSNIVSDQFTVSSSNIFTLSQSVADANNIIVSYNGIIQSPNDDYVVSGTTLSISNTTPLFSGVDIEVRHLTASSSNSAISGGSTVYETIGDLPLSNLTAGDFAFVTATNRLYIWTGTGWYNIALINTNPTITSGAAASYSLNIDGTPTVITLVANDPEDVPIAWSYAVTSGSLINGGGTSATVTQVGNEFTITPTTNQAYVGYFEITFTASDGVNLATSASTFSLAWQTSTVDYLVVAGGGGGGSRHAGGGGAGGLLQGTDIAVSGGIEYIITVGNGGAGGTGAGAYGTSNPGVSGENSSISGTGLTTITSIGGGGGGAANGGAANGGSGGGDAGYPTGGNPGKGVYPGSLYLGQDRQGYDGGIGGAGYSGGGGGGAYSAGYAQAGGNGGNGGLGLQTSITGSAVYYAGGGGGGGYNGLTPGGGGNGGGGSGTTNNADGVAGTPNTGGGGGGTGGGGTGQGSGGSGGSGLVVLRYSDTFPPAASTTGSPNITVVGGYRVYKFTQSGSITF